MRYLFALSLAVLLLSDSALAGDPESGKHNFDVRDDDAKSSVIVKTRHLRPHGPEQKAKKSKIQQEMKKAEKRLEREIAGLEVKQSRRTGAPEAVGVAHGRGKLTHGASDNRDQTLRKFLQDNADLFGLERNEINQLVKSAEYTNPAGNLSWVRLQKKIKGRSVFRGELNAAFTASGELVAVNGELPAAIEDGDAKDDPLVSAAAAVSIAAASVGIGVAPSALQLEEADGNTYVFGGPFDGDTKVELLYFPLDVGAVELAWSVLLWVDNDEAYSMIVGAELGDVLYRKNIVEDQTQPATYRVYNADSPGPLSPSNATPGSGIQGPGIGRTLFTLASEGPLFNDLGWIPDGGNTTTGNNVDAGLDLVSPDGIDAAGRPTGSPFRVFDFTYNPPPAGSDPPTNTNYRWGEVTHMFFWSNRYHDRLYELGFTEAARNFQQNNFGRGGLGNDRVLAEGQDFSGTGNANFFTPADGSPGRMQMYIFTGPNPDRTSALDQDILIHELTHGTSNRLHNDANGLNNTMSRGMGEGWSDFYARAMTSGSDEDVNGVYAAGGYSTLAIDPGFTDNYYYGIRRFPYALISTLGPNGKPHNPLTFADIDPAQIDLTDGAFPRGPIGSSNAFAVHNIGEVWASALFEVRARIINRMGWASGNQRALQIVTDGMKLDLVDPTLLDGRNSILTADCAGFAGADELDIWNGFAARGMGYSAIATSSASSTVVQAFDVPNLRAGAPAISGGSCAVNDGVADPGETVVISIPITNPFCATAATGVSVVFNSGPSVSLGTIAAGATATATFNYAIPDGSCGTMLHPAVTISSNLGSVTRILNVQVGTPVVAGPAVTYSTGGIATPLPDVSTVDIPIIVGATGPLADVNVRVRLDHTWDSDLVLSLVAPDGTIVPLSNNRGGADDNFGSGPNDCSGTFTVFDDAAATPIASGTAPFAGAFAPDGLLSAFNGHEMNGTWKLRVADTAPVDTGTAFCVQLEIARSRFFCCGGAPVITATGTSAAVSISWSAVPGISTYELYRKSSAGGAWSLVYNNSATAYGDTAVTSGQTYLYKASGVDAAGNRRSDSNVDLATTINYTDPTIVSGTIPIKAKHIIEVRTAVNAICTFAGPALCSSPPYSGNALVESYVKTQAVYAADFAGAQSSIISLRSQIGASPAVFRETPAPTAIIKRIHMEDLRTGAN